MIGKPSATMQKVLYSIFIIVILATRLVSQVDYTNQRELFDELKEKDSLVFSVGYNNCDTAQLRLLLSDDLEFYHDQDGLLESKELLLRSFPNLCRMNYKATRKLVDSTLQVFPLYSNGELYGAIQTGIHKFFGQEGDQAKYLTSTARFSHVWILEDNDTWRLKRILSYDHIASER